MRLYAHQFYKLPSFPPSFPALGEGHDDSHENKARMLYISHYETKAEKEPGNEATSMKNFNLPGREGCQELDLAL